MIASGTIINTLAVVVGSVIGLIIKGGLKKRYQETLMQALGLATMFIGVAGAMSGMLKISNELLESQGSMLLIGSLVFGALIGEFLNIEHVLNVIGKWLQSKIKVKEDNNFVAGFVTSSLVICVGAMAIVGALQDGLSGDPSTLYAKSILDFIIVMVFASSMGIGVTFSALPLFIYQGAITLFSSFLKGFLTSQVIFNLSFVGSVLIFAVGINLCFGKKIKVANLLPALIIPFFFS